MERNSNPHHLQNEPTRSLINFSFMEDNKANLNLDQILARRNRKVKLLSIIVNSIYAKSIATAFNQIKTKPYRTYLFKKRLVQVFLAMVRSSQYSHKYSSFIVLRTIFISQKHQQITQSSQILSKAKLSALKLIAILIKNQQNHSISSSFKSIQQYARRKYQQKCNKYRKGFRIWAKLTNSIIRNHLTKLRTSRYLIQKKLKVNSIVKVLKQYRYRSLKSGIERLYRNLLTEREKNIKQQIQQTQNKLHDNQDLELKSLKEKKEHLQKQIQQIKKQKQQLNLAYQTQVKQAQTKNIQTQQKTKQLKAQNQTLIKEISQLNQKLNQPYSIDQVYQIFYNNFLSYLVKNKTSTLSKAEMLDSLTKPLVPVDVPLDKMKEENKVLKELIHQYELIYGHKTLQGKEIQIPYEYLVKQNQTMYKMLVTLLPQINYYKKNLNELKQSLDSVQTIVKEFKA